MLKELFLDAHDSYHMHEIGDSALNFVLNQSVLLDDVVLQLEVFKCFDHLLNPAADLRSVLVFKVFDTGNNLATPGGEVFIRVLATPITVAGEELGHLRHVIHDLLLVLGPHLRLLLYDLLDELFQLALKLAEFQEKPDQRFVLNDFLDDILHDFVTGVLVEHGPANRCVCVAKHTQQLLHVCQGFCLLELALDDVAAQLLARCLEIIEVASGEIGDLRVGDIVHEGFLG